MFVRLGCKNLPGTNTLTFTKIRNLLSKKFYNIGARIEMLTKEHSSLFGHFISDEDLFYEIVTSKRSSSEQVGQLSSENRKIGLLLSN